MIPPKDNIASNWSILLTIANLQFSPDKDLSRNILDSKYQLIKEQDRINYDQPYKFGYSIKDKYSEQHRDEISNGAGDVKGSYGYVDAKGVYRKVEYVADKGGFRAEIKTNEPGTANQNPAYVKIKSNNPYSQKYEGYGNDMNRYQYGGYGNDKNRYQYGGYGNDNNRYQYGGYGNDKNRYQYGGYGNDNNRYQYGNEMNSYRYGNEMGGYGYGGYGNAMGGYRYGGYNRGNQYGYGDSSRNYERQGGYDSNMNYGSGQETMDIKEDMKTTAIMEMILAIMDIKVDMETPGIMEHI
ncbi:hypothetical protein CEXT_791441 [Caerostris extrusa]|uniref:Uncharacterized protein n=1 Tax=Caerostris extrusa TaxID=172846 RepID=A0AAV4M5E6_CAEEX|nr:hypothetical protein CEXT_791441 [Caerostris extrusa]